MKPSLLVIALLASSVGFPPYESSTFIDNARKVSISVPDSISIRGRSFTLSPTPSDTEYLEVQAHGRWILCADFLEADDYEQDLATSAIEHGISNCATDGDEGSTECRNIDSIQIGHNPNGVMYAEFFLLKLERYRGHDSSYVIGPYFGVDLSISTAKRMLFLPARTMEISSEERRVSQIVIDGIKLSK